LVSEAFPYGPAVATSQHNPLDCDSYLAGGWDILCHF